MTKIKTILLIVSMLTFGLSEISNAQNCPLNLRHIKMMTPCDLNVASAANGHYEATNADVTLVIDYLGVDQLKNIKTHFNKIADEKGLPKPDYSKDPLEDETSKYNNSEKITYQAANDSYGVYYIAAAEIKDGGSNVTYTIVIAYKAAKEQLGTNMANSLKYIE